MTWWLKASSSKPLLSPSGKYEVAEQIKTAQHAVPNLSYSWDVKNQGHHLP